MVRYDLALLHPPSVYDFRKRPILFGPVSDMVPSSPMFELYPMGFVSLAAYLEGRGFRVRIVNLARRMLADFSFDAERLIASLRPRAFGLDLHWLPHAQGALEVARMAKEHHPDTPVIIGGMSASYYHRELMDYPYVDYVIRGDSAEEPLLQLLRSLREGKGLAEIPNLTWRDGKGQVHENPLSYVPEDMGAVSQDYRQIFKAVARERGLANYVPFKGWMDYPIMAVLASRGCARNCVICGGSACAYQRFLGRKRPAYRAPEALAQDLWDIHRFSRGPIFVLNDIRQPGLEYARRFLSLVRGLPNQLLFELFTPAPPEFLEEMARAIPNLYLEISPESHDVAVREALGNGYSSEALEETIEAGLKAGAKRVDVFFMAGLPRQTAQSVLETADYCGHLLERYGRDGRLHPFLAPLSPFLDPGSLAFEHPQKYGYRLSCRTLEEHRQALLAPSWKYRLNYETEWMNRDQLVDSTYQALLRLAEYKAQYGLASTQEVWKMKARLREEMELIGEIDCILALEDAEGQERALVELKPRLDAANWAPILEKRELQVPVGLRKFRFANIAGLILGDWLSHLGRALKAKGRVI